MATIDSSFVDESSETNYVIHQYLDIIDDHTYVNITWRGKSTLAPSSSPVVLQVYNTNSSTWVELTSNNSTAAGTEFVLSYTIEDLTNYNVFGNLACRVYQQIT